MTTSHQQLGIVDDVDAEEQRSEGGIDQNHGPVWEQDGKQAEHQQDHHEHQQHTSLHREIPLGLEGEDRQGQEHHSGYAGSYHDDLGAKEG